MKLSQQDRYIEEVLRNLSGKTLEDIDDILRALMIYSLMQYSENEMVTLPYFGSFRFNYKGDEVTTDGRVAELETLYFPSNEVKLNLGMLEDVRKGNGKITDLPIIRHLMGEIDKELQETTDEVNKENGIDTENE